MRIPAAADAPERGDTRERPGAALLPAVSLAVLPGLLPELDERVAAAQAATTLQEQNLKLVDPDRPVVGPPAWARQRRLDGRADGGGQSLDGAGGAGASGEDGEPQSKVQAAHGSPSG